MTTLLPKLVSDLINWYQWKDSIRLVNKEYHESYRYIESYYNECDYLWYVTVDNASSIAKANWRCINDMCYLHHTGFSHIYRIKTGDLSWNKLPKEYCNCKKNRSTNFVMKRLLIKI